ncbi:MAG: hypothetical protein AB7G44_15415 [Bacteroidia bacterium]
MRKIKGSTILESLVALVVIITAMGISLVMFTHISQPQKGMLRFKAHVATINFSQSTEQKESFFDEDIFSHGFRLIKRIEKHSLTDNAYVMSIAAYDTKGNKVSEIKKIVLLHED